MSMSMVSGAVDGISTCNVSTRDGRPAMTVDSSFLNTSSTSNSLPQVATMLDSACSLTSRAGGVVKYGILPVSDHEV
jgi:hypothetical protein